MFMEFRMDLLGIILSLILLIVMIYRGFSVLVVSPLMAMLAVSFSDDMPVLTAWTGPLMEGSAHFVQAYYPVFLVGAIFGVVMNASGAAKTVANSISAYMGESRACLAVIFASFLLVYGGVAVYVVIFAAFPVAQNLFAMANLPRRFIPAAILAGAMPAYVAPGSAQFSNTIPIPVLGTTIYAAIIPGIIAVVIWVLIANVYLNRAIAKAKSNGEGYPFESEQTESADLPGVFTSFFPIIMVIVGNFLLTQYFSRPEVIEYYAPYGGVKGIWPITISISASLVVSIYMMRRYLQSTLHTLSKGAVDSLLAIFNTAVQVGYGNVIQSLSAFALIKGFLLAIPGTKLLTITVTSALLAGVVGSVSGGTGIIMEVFGDDFLRLAAEHQIDHGLIHRLVLFGCSLLDTLPHSGLVITVLAVSQCSYRESYMPVFMATCAAPAASVVAIIILGLMGVS